MIDPPNDMHPSRGVDLTPMTKVIKRQQRRDRVQGWADWETVISLPVGLIALAVSALALAVSIIAINR